LKYFALRKKADTNTVRSKSPLNAGLFFGGVVIFTYVSLTYNGVIWLEEDHQNTTLNHTAR
jgi:hypothetical protein